MYANEDEENPQDIFARFLKNKTDAEKPVFLMIASWFALHNTVSCQKGMNLVNQQDVIEDYDCGDYGRLFGFRATKKGIQAMQRLEAYVGGAQYIKTTSGNYIELDNDLKKELQLESMEFLNPKDKKEVSAFIQEIFSRHQDTSSSKSYDGLYPN